MKKQRTLKLQTPDPDPKCKCGNRPPKSWWIYDWRLDDATKKAPATIYVCPECEECPHDEHDHGICLDCGKDIFDDLVAASDFT